MMPEGWRRVPLGEVAREVRERNGNSLGEEALYGVTRGDGMVPMRMRVRGQSIDRCKIVPVGAFAYNPMRLNIGSIAQWQGDAAVMVSPDYVVFETDPAQLDSSFLNQYRRGLAWGRFMDDAGKGSVRVRIYYSNLAELELSLPPVAEQQRIATILGSVDEAMRATQAVIEQTRAVRDGLLRELLTRGIGHSQFQQTAVGRIPKNWSVRSLESLLAPVATPMRSGPFGSALLKSDLVSQGIPLLGIDNVHRERFVADYKRFVTPMKYEELVRYGVRAGDVMITIMGTVGRSCVVPEGVGTALSSKHVWTMTFDRSVYLPDLICLQLNYAPWVLEHFSRAAQGGVMDAIGSQTLKTTLLPCPPMQEQVKIAAVLKATGDSIRASEERVSGLALLKSGLMQDLLTGRVRVSPA